MNPFIYIFNVEKIVCIEYENQFNSFIFNIDGVYHEILPMMELRGTDCQCILLEYRNIKFVPS